MKIIFLLAVLFVAVFATSDLEDTSHSKTFRGALQPKPDAQILLFEVPPGVKGNFTFEMSASYDIAVCVQRFLAPSSLRSCDPNGYLEFKFNQTYSTPFEGHNDGLELTEHRRTKRMSIFPSNVLATQPTTIQRELSLREGSNFILLEFLVDSFEKNTTQNFTLVVSWKGCNQPNTHGGNDCHAIILFDNTVVVPVTSSYFQDLKFEIPPQAGQVDVIVETLDASNIQADSCSTKGFIRRGIVPESNQYDYTASCDNSTSLTASLSSPLPDMYYLRVQNDDSKNHTFKISLQITKCQGIAYGKDCKNSSQDLTTWKAGDTKKISSSGSGYDYYVVNQNEVIVGVGISKKKAPAIYASYLNFPSETNYMLKSEGNEINLIWAYYSTYFGPEVQWYISVEKGADYYIWAQAQCSQNCSSHGSCDTSTGVCSCDKSYKNELTCKKKSIVWIILIIVGAILLALLIAIPLVYCYIRNKKKARYERV